jgi:hypothetical protein
MRARRSIGLLTALPFLAIYEASGVRLDTRVETDGTGLRKVTVTTLPDRRDAVATHLAKLDPKAPWVTRDGGASDRIVRDARFVSSGPFSGMTIDRGLRFGLWPLAATTYTYTDTITRCDFTDQPKDQQAAGVTEFDYAVTMPGKIDESSILPAGGIVEANTVVWKLKADKETLDVSVTSARPEWMFLVLVLYILIALAALTLRFTFALQRSQPRKI